jgi:hypothetical protein
MSTTSWLPSSSERFAPNKLREGGRFHALFLTFFSCLNLAARVDARMDGASGSASSSAGVDERPKEDGNRGSWWRLRGARGRTAREKGAELAEVTVHTLVVS